jgi:hypothetical protein
MTTSNLVGLETQSSQERQPQTFDPSILAGATQRLGAYSRLKNWLGLPQADATAAALAFYEAVKTLPPLEQQQVAEAEADALRHGFSFIDFQKLKGLALKAIEDPFAGAGFEDDQSYPVAAMLALQN